MKSISSLDKPIIKENKTFKQGDLITDGNEIIIVSSGSHWKCAGTILHSNDDKRIGKYMSTRLDTANYERYQGILTLNN